MATLTTTELAEEFGTSTRTLRKFLRADARNRDAADTLPGKGARYAIERKAVQGLKKRFGAWQVAEAQAKAERAAQAAQELEGQVETDAPEVEVETPDAD